MGLQEKVRSAWATLMLHNQNELSRINRAATAKAWGLEPETFATPYTQQTITNNATSPMASLLLGAVCGIGALGGGALLCNWLTKPGKPEVIEKIQTELKEWDSAVEMEVQPPEGYGK